MAVSRKRITAGQRTVRFAVLIGLVAALGAGSVACGATATSTPTPAPVTTPAPSDLFSFTYGVALPPIPPATTTFYDCYFEPSEGDLGHEYWWERIPIDLNKGDIVAVSIDVISSGQGVSVAVKDPAGGDLLTFQSAAARTISFKAETNGTHTIIVAQMDQRGGAPVSAIVRYYPVGS